MYKPSDKDKTKSIEEGFGLECTFAIITTVLVIDIVQMVRIKYGD